MKNISLKKGFTLVEIIISLAIFAIVALVAVGALIKVMDANRKAISLKTSINNLNFALESMSREMRMGSMYTCANANTTGNFLPSNKLNKSTSCSQDSWIIAFRSSKKNSYNNCNLTYAYKYVNSTFYKAEQTDSNNCNTPITQDDFYPLISEQITINKALIQVDNLNQPKIFLYINGESPVIPWQSG